MSERMHRRFIVDMLETIIGNCLACRYEGWGSHKVYNSSRDFKLGSFLVSPLLGEIRTLAKTSKIEPLVIDTLAILASNAGNVVLREEFMTQIWPSPESSDESLTRAISILRKVFKQGDPETKFIETISKRGYRLLVEPETKVSQKRNTDTNSQQTPLADDKKTQLLLQGRSLTVRPFHLGVLPTAAALFESAIELDENFAEAYSELGHTYSLMSTYINEADKHDLVKKAAKCAQKAISLKPETGFPYTLIALLKFTQGDIVGAIDLTEKAHQLSPEDPEVIMRLGYLYAAIGLTKHALIYLQRAADMDPTQGRNFQILATVKLNNGELDEAERYARRAIDMQHHFSHETYAAVAFAKGEFDTACQRMFAGLPYLIEFFDQRPDDKGLWNHVLENIYSPDPYKRVEMGESIKGMLHKKGSSPPVFLTQALLRTGAAEAYFEVMGNTPPVGSHGTMLGVWADTDPCRTIRNDPGFFPHCSRMGMANAWKKYGYPDALPRDVSN